MWFMLWQSRILCCLNFGGRLSLNVHAVDSDGIFSCFLKPNYQPETLKENLCFD